MGIYSIDKSIYSIYSVRECSNKVVTNIQIGNLDTDAVILFCTTEGDIRLQSI